LILGSAALNFAFVSAGNCDIYCHAGIRCWDMAAGALLVQEAGGVVLDPSGKGTNLRIYEFLNFMLGIL
jgi:myo-inositol-1(or 4)-monophosphatase